MNRNINLFEKILLPVGIAVTIFGLFMLLQAERFYDNPAVWGRITAVFTWLILIVVIILAATIEDVKEELSTLSREHTIEIKLLKEIAHDQLQELKVLTKRHKK